MALKVRVRGINPFAPRRRFGYAFRPISFFASGGLHALILCALGLISPFPSATERATSNRPLYDELIKPREKKITWYDFRKPLPEVNAQERIGTFPKPRGQELSKVAIIASAPKATSTKQFVWQPIPKVEIQQDLKAPNLVLRAATAIPAPVPPPPEAKKIPRPNLEGLVAKQPNASPPTDKGDVNKAQETPEQKAVEVPKPRKAFVAPPASKQEAQLTISVTVSDLPTPDASITGAQSVKMVLPEGLGAPTLSSGAPPPSNATPGTTNSPGNSKVDMAIASLDPADKLTGPLPNGSRPGQFSKAPIVGETATGETNGMGLAVPGLTIHEDRSKPVDPPRVNPNRKTMLYADRVRNIPISTLSVPLRPASRTIPRAIDARFQNRYVYTMVIPIENIAEYSGDWIIWFAERELKPGEGPNVRAPIPLRKFEPVEPVLPGARTELRVQVAATIRKDGKLEGVTLLRNLALALEQAVLQDISSWEFKPALRDGNPVDVDIVLEVPFSLPPQMAKGTQP